MAIPLIDERHRDLKNMAQRIAYICLSDEFISLKKELESLYLRYGQEQPAVLAFEDALYTFMAESEVEGIRFRAY